jgi:protein OS-9
MVIHTPRLCGVPGFRTRLEQREEAPIRCREVLVDPEAVEHATLAEVKESAQPMLRRPGSFSSEGRKGRVSGVLEAAEQRQRHQHQHQQREKSETNTRGKGGNRDKKKAQDVQKALQELLGGNLANVHHPTEGEGEHGPDHETLVVAGDDGEDFYIDIQYVDLDDPDSDGAGGGVGVGDDLLQQLERAIGKTSGTIERLEEILREAGYDVSAVPAAGEDDEEEGERERDDVGEGEKEDGSGAETDKKRGRRTDRGYGGGYGGARHEEL